MALNQPKNIPGTQREWERKAKELGLEDHEYRRFDIPRMQSASRVDFKNWIRLKTIWKTHSNRSIHKFIFGTSSEIERWATISADSKAFLQQLEWYPALQSFSDDPRDWGTLASWRQSTLTISRRLHVLIQKDAPKLQPQLSGEDLFASSKMWLEPRASQDIQMKESGPQSEEGEIEEYGEEGESGKNILARLHRDRYGQWIRTKDETPPNRDSPSSDENMASPVESSHSTNQSPSSHKGSSEGLASSAYNSHMTGSSMSFLGAGLSRPPDEEIIHMSLVLLLEGLCMHDPMLRGKVGWYPIRKPFSVTQAGVKVMTARTDGCLQVLHPNLLEEDCPSLVILEAKADMRTTESTSVYLQEGAEMAAWISSESNSGLLRGSQDTGTYRRVLISQNFDQVFVNIAEYDDDYVHYITGHGAATRLSSGSPTQNISAKKASGNISARRESPDRELSGRGLSGRGLSVRGLSDRELSDRELSDRELFDRESPDRGPSPPILSHFQPGTTPSPKDLSHLIQNAPVKNKGSTLGYDFTRGFLVMHKFKGFKITERRDVEELMILLVSLVRELYHGSQWDTRL